VEEQQELTLDGLVAALAREAPGLRPLDAPPPPRPAAAVARLLLTSDWVDATPAELDAVLRHWRDACGRDGAAAVPVTRKLVEGLPDLVEHDAANAAAVRELAVWLALSWLPAALRYAACRTAIGPVDGVDSCRRAQLCKRFATASGPPGRRRGPPGRRRPRPRRPWRWTTSWRWPMSWRRPRPWRPSPSVRRKRSSRRTRTRRTSRWTCRREGLPRGPPSLAAQAAPAVRTVRPGPRTRTVWCAQLTAPPTLRPGRAGRQRRRRSGQPSLW